MAGYSGTGVSVLEGSFRTEVHLHVKSLWMANTAEI